MNSRFFSYTGGAALLAVLAITSATQAAPGSRPKTKGTYELVFAGALRGTGTAKVNPNHVKLEAVLKGSDGGGGKLDAPKLKLDDGRFTGAGTLDGQPVEIIGRVDAAEGGVVHVARLVITIRIPDGRFARGVGKITQAEE